MPPVHPMPTTMNQLNLYRNLLIFTLIVCGEFTLQAEYDPGYYSGLDGKRKENLKAAVKTAVKNHKQLVYMDLPTYWQYSDVYPETVNGMTRWWEMYSDENYYIQKNQSAKASFSANKMQREHSVPKSWWKVGNDVEYTPAYSDLWNLYPSDAAANLAKSNYPLGIVDRATFDNGVTKVGVPVYGYGGGAECVFEPADEYKGDFARSFFYMACVYDDLPWVNRYNWMFIQSPYPTLQPWAYDMLLQWARTDGVSQKEILRNDAVEKSQGNRNPFVDFPELAEYIWGTRTSETFLISEQGGAVTPPITGDPELTQPVNDEWLDFGEVAAGGISTSWLLLKGKNFTAPLSVRIAGTDKDMFNLSTRSIPASAINTTGEYMLTIEYMPTAIGNHTATLAIYDGGMASSVRVNIKGEGVAIPELSRLQALNPTDVTDNAYTACWSAAPETVDYYVVYRTRYYEDGEETDQLESDTNSLRISDRNPAVDEAYSVCSSRLGYLSERSNTILLPASGIDETATDEPRVTFARSEGGIRVLTAENNVDVDIFDMSGRLAYAFKGMTNGDFIPLTHGVWLITSPRQSLPSKIIL